MKTKILFAFLIMILVTPSISSQVLSGRVYEVFTFSKDSMEKEFVINLNEGIARIEIDLKAEVKNGLIAVEIFSPSGNLVTDLKLDANRKGHYKEETSKVTVKGNILTRQEVDRFRHYIGESKDSTVVNGAILQTESNPQEGNWLVKMTPEQAEGEVEISYSLR